MIEKINVVNTNKKEVSDTNDLLVSTRNNPNKYNGESLEIKLFTKKNANSKQVYIESYGCQMNFSDSEVVASILAKEGYQTTPKMETADLILVNTCSIREKAEETPTDYAG